MKTQIIIDNKPYILDIDRAKELNILEEENNYPLKQGDVYVFPHINPLLLVEAQNRLSEQRYQLLGLGCEVNRDYFYSQIQTKEEIRAYISQNKGRFSRNIDAEIYHLVSESK